MQPATIDDRPFHIIKDGIVYELERDPQSGAYTITVPALPGCISEGDSIEHALEMIAEAMELWLDVAREDGVPIPSQFDAERPR